MIVLNVGVNVTQSFYLRGNKPIPPASEPAVIQLLKLVIREFVAVHANVFMCVQASSSP